MVVQCARIHLFQFFYQTAIKEELEQKEDHFFTFIRVASYKNRSEDLCLCHSKKGVSQGFFLYDKNKYLKASFCMKRLIYNMYHKTYAAAWIIQLILNSHARHNPTIDC